MYAIPEKLRDFRKAKGLTQEQIADMLSMEQTTYGKVELGKNSLRFETALKIAKIIEKDISEFTTMPQIINNVNDCTLTNSSVNVNGDVTYSNCNTSVPDKITILIEELLVLFKQYLKNK
jgi:transcriptional regulator with XRE-family HTH domain